MTLLTSISHRQCDDLEEMFAVLTEEGWVVPEWCLVLRKAIEERANERAIVSTRRVRPGRPVYTPGLPDCS